MTTIIEVNQLHKRYGDTIAVDEVSFGAPDMQGVNVTVDAAYVLKALTDIVEDQDLSRYVL